MSSKNSLAGHVRPQLTSEHGQPLAGPMGAALALETKDWNCDDHWRAPRLGGWSSDQKRCSPAVALLENQMNGSYCRHFISGIRWWCGSSAVGHGLDLLYAIREALWTPDFHKRDGLSGKTWPWKWRPFFFFSDRDISLQFLVTARTSGVGLELAQVAGRTGYAWGTTVTIKHFLHRQASTAIFAGENGSRIALGRWWLVWYISDEGGWWLGHLFFFSLSLLLSRLLLFTAFSPGSSHKRDIDRKSNWWRMCSKLGQQGLSSINHDQLQ